ncbi:dimethylamine monooxygenase subunit DmmA family protein [Cochlodiniinecator piscidefendens]|uniref:dimethylamine monooxygenase subunit DmmA family protein n=1 Tax=Cochlodiniinecator piscidefendens TaxID=2715756 RepID=UPI001409AAD4|nr:dimethylamine monooxygenase subunit DmmA family protein [Cochlodiniinecator piscidefendens]
MAKFEFPPSILSRPVWGRLEARSGKSHLMIADAEGAEAILDIATPELMENTHIIYIPKGANHADKLRALAPAQFYEGPSYDASVQRIRRVLSGAHMGLQVYLTGTESLMGQAMRETSTAGIPHSAVQTEHRGSVARRMQCVHCKGITEDVELDPFVCSHCGLNLFVRDHYSRRHAAYQGVCVDAEDHGNIPEPKGIYE